MRLLEGIGAWAVDKEEDTQIKLIPSHWVGQPRKVSIKQVVVINVIKSSLVCTRKLPGSIVLVSK